jgi:hypothetical protein
LHNTLNDLRHVCRYDVRPFQYSGRRSYSSNRRALRHPIQLTRKRDVYRLRRLDYRNCTRHKVTKFLQSTEVIFKQIAQREHRVEILEKGISAFLKYKTRKLPKELNKRLRETAAVLCNTTRMETEHSQESTKAKFAFSNRSGQECAFNSAAVFFVRLREIGLPLNADNDLKLLFNLFTAHHE